MLLPRNLLRWLSVVIPIHCFPPGSWHVVLSLIPLAVLPSPPWAGDVALLMYAEVRSWWHVPTMCCVMGRAFFLVGARCAGVARAAFREAGRCCGTRTAGVVLKLCAVHVRPFWVSYRWVFCTSSSSRELPLAKQNPVARPVSWQSGVSWRKPRVF